MTRKYRTGALAVMFSLGLLFVSCGAGARLTEVEARKLDLSLQRLLSGEKTDAAEFDTAVRPDGSIEFAVVVRSTNVEEIRNAGCSVSSAFGEVATVRATKDELMKLLKLPSVRSVSNGSKNYLH